MNDERSRIEKWMLAIISDGGIDRLDHLHIDPINPRWKDKNRWIEGGLEAFRIALSVRDQHRLPFTVSLTFSLVDIDHLCGIDFQTREDLLAKLDWAPPSLYLFDRGKEPDKQTAPLGGPSRFSTPPSAVRKPMTGATISNPSLKMTTSLGGACGLGVREIYV